SPDEDRNTATPSSRQSSVPASTSPQSSGYASRTSSALPPSRPSSIILLNTSTSEYPMAKVQIKREQPLEEHEIITPRDPESTLPPSAPSSSVVHLHSGKSSHSVARVQVKREVLEENDVPTSDKDDPVSIQSSGNDTTPDLTPSTPSSSVLQLGTNKSDHRLIKVQIKQEDQEDDEVLYLHRNKSDHPMMNVQIKQEEQEDDEVLYLDTCKSNYPMKKMEIKQE
ncbi:hypothetical protein PMAYCL1PPCAC_09420, partial [Pristionchus mayeri]